MTSRDSRLVSVFSDQLEDQSQ